MKDSIHKRLTDHIRKTVGRYELPYEPGSWEEFQRLQRKRRRQPVVWFRYALAACLLLGVLGVPVWLYVGRPNAEELAVNPSKTGFTTKKPGRSAVENRQLNGAILPDSSTPKSPKGDLMNPDVTPSKSPLGDLGVEGQNAKIHQKESQQNRSETQELAVSKNRPKTGNESRPTGSNGPENPSNDLRQTNIPTNPPTELISQTGSYAFITPRSIRFSQRPIRPLSLPLSSWKNEPAIAKIDPPKTAQKLIWGVSMAPQSVYAAGSSRSVAVGGGLFSEIPLNQQFSLSTGLSMAQQKLGTKETNLMVFSTVPHLVSTGIRLTSVDLPLNLRFRPTKWSVKGFYVEAGLSSLAFLNEHYTYTYEQTRLETIFVMGTNGQEQQVTQQVTAQQTTTQSEPAFRQIYWGRIINLSVGVERRLGTQFRLSAEPYLKYPIGPFTRENLMLGSGGVSLRLGFQSGR